jgi:serine/threonine protein kinase
LTEQRASKAAGLAPGSAALALAERFMAKLFPLAHGQSVQASSGAWYENIQVLGEGGNAITYLTLATSGPHKGLLFATKVFRNLDKPERRESFLGEVGFLKGCSHPSVMRVFDEGVYRDSFPFVVAEYLPSTLSAVIRAGTASTVAKLSYVLQLLSALDYLAKLSEPVIHRDIKPQNIFIKGHSCVLGDFGLLKRVTPASEEDRTAFKQSVGVGMPFRYRTPDLVRYLEDGVAPGCKSDVYQLGLVVAELFTGKNPQRPRKDFRAPIKLDKLAKVPGARSSVITALIQRMLREDPAERDPAERLLDPWQGVFREAIKQAHALEGRVF